MSQAVSSLADLLKQAADQTDQFLTRYLQENADVPSKLTEAMSYSLLGPGKRIRPALAMLCCQAVGGDPKVALPAGAAVELIHCFSLIHDDLPAMDDDDLRRGRPTNHKVYGEAMAILAGDALNTLAFELLATQIPEPRLAVRLITELAQATGGAGMIGGQVLDTCHPEDARNGQGVGTLPGLQRIHRMKTGALIRSACRMGAMVAGASPEALELIDTYGQAIGLAFQIVDDLLDVTATAAEMGKRTGKDAAIGKLTYPSLLGMEASRAHLQAQVELTEKVAAALGPQAAMLAELSHTLAARTH